MFLWIEHENSSAYIADTAIPVAPVCQSEKFVLPFYMWYSYVSLKEVLKQSRLSQC